MARAKANGIELEYETHGDVTAEPIVLVMGLGAQMTRWPPELYGKLVERGLRVVRFDNRDIGLSDKIEKGGRPDFAAILQAIAQGRKPEVPYQLEDMAADVMGLLDALEIERAHIAGASLGGMVSQLVAINYPQRVLSLTSIMSSTGNRSLDLTTPEAHAVLTTRGPDPAKDLEGYLAHSVNSARTIGSPAPWFDEMRARERLLSDYRRSFYPDGFARQYAAALAAPDRREQLKTIKAPVMVVHGEADPLLKVAGGRDTQASIPGAELRIIPGMGHDLPPQVHDQIIDAIMRAVTRARAAQSSR